MKKNLVLLGIFSFLVLSKSYGENQFNACDCFNGLRGFNRIYKNAWIGNCSKDSHSYPFSLESASIKSRMIADPSNYFEYYHNLHIFNDSLINYLNYKMNECEVYPNFYGKDRDKVRNDLLNAIEANDEADQYVKNRARLIYENCYRSKHLNPWIFYDHGFLEFVEGNANKSAELAEKYIQICKERNISHQSNPAELILLGQSYMETAQYSKAIE